jgi:hypothetical protein
VGSYAKSKYAKKAQRQIQPLAHEKAGALRRRCNSADLPERPGIYIRTAAGKAISARRSI